MTKNRFVELKLNGQLIIREKDMKTMSYKLKHLYVNHLMEHPKATVNHVISSMPLNRGNIFEATL